MFTEPDLTPQSSVASEEFPDETAVLIRQAERARLRALVTCDMSAADALHADDFHLVTPNGSEYSKTDYLTAVETGRIDYRSWEITSDIAVRVHGDAAAIRYQSLMDMRFEGNPATFRCWHTDTYERRDGRWQVVWSQATMIS